jgi:DUF971 family protein
MSVPEPEHIAISKSKGIRIDWKDGHHSEFPLGYLRDECPCASCSGAHGTVPQRTSYAKDEADRAESAKAAPNPFQMYKPVLRMLSVEQVGAYAIRVDWSDGHNTGIYSFDYLRNICRCAECAQEAMK